MSGREEDLDFVERVLAGDGEAAAEFRERFTAMLRGNLMSRCADNRSREQAQEIVEDVISDCFGGSGKEPLLKLYRGRSPLENWISSVAINRLKNWWRSGRRKYEEPEGHLSDPEEEVGGGVIAAARAAGEVSEDPDVAEILCDALLAAFAGVRPRDLVFLRLVHLGGIKRVRLAEIWGVDPATVGRRMEQAVEETRTAALAYLKKIDPELDITWEDCLAICARFPQVLLGDEPEEENENPVRV